MLLLLSTIYEIVLLSTLRTTTKLYELGVEGKGPGKQPQLKPSSTDFEQVNGDLFKLSSDNKTKDTVKSLAM